MLIMHKKELQINLKYHALRESTMAKVNMSRKKRMQVKWK